MGSDVQDFLHAILKLYFDDIRTEEWHHSFAASYSRTDFLLKFGREGFDRLEGALTR